MPHWVQMHGLTAWSTQPQHDEPAPVPAVGSVDLSMPYGQNHPMAYGGALHIGTHAGGGPISTLSTGVTASPPEQWSGGNLLYAPVISHNANDVMLVPPNHHHQVANDSDVMLVPPNHHHQVAPVNHTITPPPAASAGAAVPNPIGFGAPHPNLSRTRTGRSGPKRGMLGQEFEPNLERVQQRLGWEGGDARAIENLRNDIFPDGIITRAGLKSLMSPEQRRRVRHGTQKYMLLVETLPHPQRGVDHRCLLCPSQTRAEFKNREDTLRHIYKDHLGLSVDCDQW